MNQAQAINNQPQRRRASALAAPLAAPLVAIAAALFVASCGGSGSGGGVATNDVFVGGGGIPNPPAPAAAPTPAGGDGGVPSDEITASQSAREIQAIAPAFTTTDASLGVLPVEIVPDQYNRRALHHVSEQNDFLFHRLADNFGRQGVREIFFNLIDKNSKPPQTYITIAAPYALANPTLTECTPETRHSRPDLCPDPAVLEPSRVCTEADVVYRKDQLGNRVRDQSGRFIKIGFSDSPRCDAANAGAYSGYWYERIIATTIGELRYDPGGLWGTIESLDDDRETPHDERSRIPREPLPGEERDETLTPQPGGEVIPPPVDVPPPHPPLIPGDNADGTPIIPPPVERPPTIPAAPTDSEEIPATYFDDNPLPVNNGYITIQRCNTPIDETVIMQTAASYNCLTGAAEGHQAPDILFYPQIFHRSPHLAIEHAFTFTNSAAEVVTLKFNPTAPDGDIDLNDDGVPDGGYLPSQADAVVIARSMGYDNLDEYYRDSLVNHFFSPKAAGLDDAVYDPLIILPAIPKPPEIPRPLSQADPNFPIHPPPPPPPHATPEQVARAAEAYNSIVANYYEAYINKVNDRQAAIDSLVNVFFPAAVKADNVLFVAPVIRISELIPTFDGSVRYKHEYAARPGFATCGEFRLQSVLDICLSTLGFYNNGSISSSILGASTGYNTGLEMEGEAVAASFVAGMASIVRAQWPSLTAAETRDILLACARNDNFFSGVASDPVVAGAGVLQSLGCLLDPLAGSNAPCSPDDFAQDVIADGDCNPIVSDRGDPRVVSINDPLPEITADSASGGVLSPDSFNSDAFVFYDYFNRDFKRDVVTSSSSAPAHLAPFSHPLSLVRHNTSNNAFSDDSAFAPTISHTFSSKACSLAVGVALESASFAGASGYGDFELGTSYTPHLAGACSFNLPNNSSVSLFASHTRSVMPSAAQQSIVSRIEGSQSVLGARLTSQKGPLLLSLEARHGSGVKGSLHAFGKTLAVNPKPWTHASFSLALPF